MKYVPTWAIALLMVALIVAPMFFLPPHDDTDEANKRSGLSLYTDAKTGCQYLAAGGIFGSAVTPRMDSAGKQICNKTVEGKKP